MLEALFFFRVPAGVEFPVLETLSLSGCMVDLSALLLHCMVHSASLHELVMENKWMRNVDIVAPSLKQLNDVHDLSH